MECTSDPLLSNSPTTTHMEVMLLETDSIAIGQLDQLCCGKDRTVRAAASWLVVFNSLELKCEGTDPGPLSAKPSHQTDI